MPNRQLISVASCKCLFFRPFFHLLCLTNQLLVCRPSVATLLRVTDFRTRLRGHSFVHCLGAAERVRPAGSRQLVWDTVERGCRVLACELKYTFLLSSIASDSTFCSILILPFVLSLFYLLFYPYSTFCSILILPFVLSLFYLLFYPYSTFCSILILPFVLSLFYLLFYPYSTFCSILILPFVLSLFYLLFYPGCLLFIISTYKAVRTVKTNPTLLRWQLHFLRGVPQLSGWSRDHRGVPDCRGGHATTGACPNCRGGHVTTGRRYRYFQRSPETGTLFSLETIITKSWPPPR